MLPVNYWSQFVDEETKTPTIFKYIYSITILESESNVDKLDRYHGVKRGGEIPLHIGTQVTTPGTRP